MDKVAIDFDFRDWKIPQKPRTRDRMKLQVKLSKIESQSFKNFMDTVKPVEVSEDDFMKAIFRVGMEEMESQLVKAAQEYVDEHKEELQNNNNAELLKGVDLSVLEKTSETVEVIE